MIGNDAVGEEQSKSGPLTGRFCAEKRVKDTVENVDRNAGAVIRDGHVDPQCSLDLHRFRSNTHHAWAIHRTDRINRIIDEIEKDRFQAIAISHDRWKRSRQVTLKLNGMSRDTFVRNGQAGTYDAVEIQRLERRDGASRKGQNAFRHP